MSANDDLPWNTTRCNRLLRPLSSKLSKLRKELERPRSSNGDRRTSANSFSLKASPRKVVLVSQSSLSRKPRLFEKRKDPDWIPDAGPHGANRKTYGARGAKKAHNVQRTSGNGRNTRPGELPFTPLISRIGGNFKESPQTEASPARRHPKNRGPLNAKVEQIQELKKQLPGEIGKLVNGLSEAYANLLMATATEGEKRRSGTRSLFSSCVRKIPEYIQLEEYFAALDKEEEDDDDDDRDLSQETYTYLETQFESISGQGWRAFKQVVRAHGTSLVCDAFTDQLLGLVTLHVLVSHCLHSAFWDEAEQLLLAYLPNLKPILLPNTLAADLFDGERSPYMWLCKSFVGRTGRHRFLYDLLAYLISQDLLPLEWLATESMRPVWDRLVRTLADGDPRSMDSAFRLLEVAVAAAIGLSHESLREDDSDMLPRQFKPSARHEFRKALDTTFSSLFTIFCSIALVNQSRDEGSGELIAKRVTWVLDSIVIGLLERANISEDLKLLGPITDYTQTFAERAVWLMFSSFLIHLNGCHMDSSTVSLDIPTTVKAINWIISHYASYSVDVSTVLSTLPEITSSTAQATGKIWKDDGFDQIQRFVNGMLSLSGIRLPHKLWTLKRLALEAAMEFAHSTGDAQHMAYAIKIEKTMRTKGHVVISQSPHKGDSPSSSGGFRWEEGIGEWVACTPFAKQDVKPIPRKPMRSLSLLPSPDWSQDKETDTEELPTTTGSDQPIAETLDDDEDYTFPQSSPVKSRRQVPKSALGKRSRAPSPIVFIPVKRTLPTPPKSPLIFYPELPDSQSDDGMRRSSGSNNDAEVFAAKRTSLRPRPSRTSLDKGLRNQKRKSYALAQDIYVDFDTSHSESEETLEPNPPSSTSAFHLTTGANMNTTRLRKIRKRASVGKRSKSDGANGGENENEDEISSDELASRSSSRLRKSRSGRRIQVPREWWKVESDSPGGANDEDELSF
ncbi:hypothetical protein DM02DRAFT_620131 [Periconia macrospinosa]|uniref:Uncharacterized protein n=1 Tax=Periconia macrospinosa TaxID=97972 RepID=A0A2V1D296_9PLEO|nr:hypothetical protein DM02DRAFT_620131 [Periconia macrospinosa]